MAVITTRLFSFLSLSHFDQKFCPGAKKPSSMKVSSELVHVCEKLLFQYIGIFGRVG